MSLSPARRFAIVPCLVVCFALTLAACASKTSTPEKAAEAERPQPVKPAEVSPPARAQIRMELATGYYERGRFDIAIEELDAAVKLDPQNARVYNLYGLVYTMLDESVKAEANFAKALALAPNDPEIHHNWGWYLCTHGRAQQSIAEFDRAASDSLYKTPEVAYVNAGKCSASLGNAAAAEGYYKRALAISANQIEASFGLAVLSFRSGRLADARAYIKPVMAQNNPSASALYLGACIERSLGDKQSETSYVTQLRNRFPDSGEMKAYAAGSCQ